MHSFMNEITAHFAFLIGISFKQKSSFAT